MKFQNRSRKPPRSRGYGDRDTPSKERRDDELLTPEEAAAFAKVSPRTLAGKRVRGDGPVYVALSSRLIRYWRSDLIRWTEESLRRSTSDSGNVR